jgi:hypothetical protein
MIKFKSDAIAIGIGSGSAPAPASGRPSFLPKISKPFRIGLVALASVLGVWLYWMHLVGLTRVHAAAATAPAVTATAAVGKTATAAETAKAAPAATSASESARDQVMAVWTYLLESVKAAPIQAAPKPAAPATGQPAAPVAASTVVAAAAPRVAPKPLTDQDRLLQAAQIAFHNVMDQASAYPDSYGFQAEDVLMNARLGSPLPVYTVAEQDYLNYQDGQALKPLLKLADQWVFPVSIGSRVCCMVQVSHVGHSFVPGGGNKMLGQAWNKIIQKWPASAGFHPQLVVNANVPGYYFTVPELPTQNLTDIIRMFEYETDLSPAAVIMASWR